MIPNRWNVEANYTSVAFERSRTIGSYAEKRVRRIYPGYLVAISICAFVVVPLFSTHANITPTEVLRTYAYNLVLSGHFPPSDAFAHNPFPSAVNGSLWSIPFEFWCYLGVAVLGVVSLATNKRVLLGLTVGVMTARVLCDLAGVKPYLGPVSVVIGWPYIWLKILPSFLLGMVAYAFQAQLPRSRGLMAVLTGAAIAACWLNGHVADMIVAPALAYVIFYVGFSDRLRLHNAARFGDFSYGTYLYAFPIQQMLQSTKQLTLPEFIGASMILSLLAGVLSWHLVEKHFMSRRRKMQPLLAPA